MEISDLKIRGTEVAYYIICKRKLWLFCNSIDFERFSEYVELGKIISETFFKREKMKEVEIDNFKIS
jgi:CRISPR-associated exonuclease Cas4